MAKEGTGVEARARRSSLERPGACDRRFSDEPKLRRAGARRIGRQDRRQRPGDRLRSESRAPRAEREKFSRWNYTARHCERHRGWRPACCMATRTNRRARRDGRFGHDDSNDSLPGRCRPISHLPREHPDAVPRKQLHDPAGQKQ